MRFTVPLALLAIASFPVLAHADCQNPANQAESIRCLGESLTDSDQKINQTYQALRAKLDDAGKTKLRDEQRAWLKERAQVCRIDDKEADRTKWLAAILKDPAKTVCVVRYTRQREEILAASLAAGTVEEAQSSGDAVYELNSHAAHKTGKWYFEVTLQTGAIAAQHEMEFAIGVNPADGGGMAFPDYIRKNQKGESATVVGIAVDLDKERVYMSTNGAFDEQPGSSGGQPLKPNLDYRAYVSSSSDMADLLKAGTVKPDFGDHAFTYAVPAGYKAFGP